MLHANATTLVGENHDNGATKSSDKADETSQQKDSMPKDQPAVTVPESKNIITVGYALSKEPVIKKDIITDVLLNPSSKNVEDLPFLKKPSSVESNMEEDCDKSKGVSISEESLSSKKMVQAPVLSFSESEAKVNATPDSLPKESLNYQGQVPLFSRTMETCDLNPGGKTSSQDVAQKSEILPINGDIDDTSVEAENTAEISSHSLSVDPKRSPTTELKETPLKLEVSEPVAPHSQNSSEVVAVPGQTLVVDKTPVDPLTNEELISLPKLDPKEQPPMSESSGFTESHQHEPEQVEPPKVTTLDAAATGSLDCGQTGHVGQQDQLVAPTITTEKTDSKQPTLSNTNNTSSPGK